MTHLSVFLCLIPCKAIYFFSLKILPNHWKAFPKIVHCFRQFPISSCCCWGVIKVCVRSKMNVSFQLSFLFNSYQNKIKNKSLNPISFFFAKSPVVFLSFIFYGASIDDNRPSWKGGRDKFRAPHRKTAASMQASQVSKQKKNDYWSQLNCFLGGKKCLRFKEWFFHCDLWNISFRGAWL